MVTYSLVKTAADDHGELQLAHEAHHVEHLADQFGVERGCWLIKKHDSWLHGERAGNGNALFLPSGKAIGIFIFLKKHANTIQVFLRQCNGFVFIHAFDSDRSFNNVFQHTHMGEEVEFLKDHPGFQPDLMNELLVLFALLSALHFDPIHFNDATGWLLQEIDAAQEGALARSAPSNEADNLAFLYIKAYIFQNVQPTEIFVEVRNFDNGSHLIDLRERDVLQDGFGRK